MVCDGRGVASAGAGIVEMRYTPYDADAVCAEIIAGSAFPEVTEWTDEYLRGQISDADALAVMAPRDGRLPDRRSNISAREIQSGPPFFPSENRRWPARSPSARPGPP
jgi:hypothetical protein